MGYDGYLVRQKYKTINQLWEGEIFDTVSDYYDSYNNRRESCLIKTYFDELLTDWIGKDGTKVKIKVRDGAILIERV